MVRIKKPQYARAGKNDVLLMPVDRLVPEVRHVELARPHRVPLEMDAPLKAREHSACSPPLSRCTGGTHNSWHSFLSLHSSNSLLSHIDKTAEQSSHLLVGHVVMLVGSLTLLRTVRIYAEWQETYRKQTMVTSLMWSRLNQKMEALSCSEGARIKVWTNGAFFCLFVFAHFPPPESSMTLLPDFPPLCWSASGAQHNWPGNKIQKHFACPPFASAALNCCRGGTTHIRRLIKGK